MADSTLIQLIWVRVKSNLTDESGVEHNPGGSRWFTARLGAGDFVNHSTKWLISPLVVDVVGTPAGLHSPVSE